MPIYAASAPTAMNAGEAGPFTVEYFCPRQSPYWQRSRRPGIATWREALAEAQMIKPARGAARILNVYGQERLRI